MHELIRGDLGPIIILFLLSLDLGGEGAVKGSLVASEKISEKFMGRVTSRMQGVKKGPVMMVKLNDV